MYLWGEGFGTTQGSFPTFNVQPNIPPASGHRPPYLHRTRKASSAIARGIWRFYVHSYFCQA